MNSKKRKITFFLKSALPLILLLTVIYFLNINIHLPKFKVSKQESATVFNENFLKIFSLGHRRLIASSLWVQTLLESDIDQYKTSDLNSWLYLRFNSIIQLDPLFYHAYLFGGQYLSIIKDDDLGAKDIYEKSFKVFPNDFWLNYHGAFHYYFELNDIENAIIHYEKLLLTSRIEKYPYLKSLIAKLKIKRDPDDLETAFSLIKTSYNEAPPKSNLKKKFKKSLYAIKAEMDLKCLNNGGPNCSTRDFEGIHYIKLPNESFKASKEWEPFRPKR